MSTYQVVKVAEGGTNLKTCTAGDILYCSSAGVWALLPKGADGEVLTLASGFPDWVAPSGGSPSMVANNYSYAFYDFVTNNSQLYGVWNRYSSGGSGGFVGMLNSTSPGAYNLTSTALGSSILNTGDAITIGGAKLTIEWRVRVPNLCTGTEDAIMFAGLYDSSYTTAFASADDMIGFRYSFTENSGKWLAFTRKNGSETPVDTGITVAANTWYRLRLSVNAAGTSVSFEIDGTPVTGTPITTTIPNGAPDNLLYAAYLEKTIGTSNAKSFYQDYCEVLWEFASGRQP